MKKFGIVCLLERSKMGKLAIELNCCKFFNCKIKHPLRMSIAFTSKILANVLTTSILVVPKFSILLKFRTLYPHLPANSSCVRLLAFLSALIDFPIITTSICFAFCIPRTSFVAIVLALPYKIKMRF